MAYDKEKLYKKALERAKMEDIYFIEDVVGLLACSKTTFYDYFPAGSDELDSIKEILEMSKITKKAELREKLSRSDKAAEVLALYKLIGTDEERKKLSQGYVDVTTGGEKMNGKINLNVSFENFGGED